MEAIKLLERQHDEIDGLFAQYETAEDAAQKLEVFHQLADALIAHATIEQKLFYPAVFVGELKEQLLEAVSDHLRVKRLISELFDLSPLEAKFDATIDRLQDEVTEHASEEEDVLFPLVKEALLAYELEALGEAMEEMYEEVISGTTPRDELSDVDDALPVQ